MGAQVSPGLQDHTLYQLHEVHSLIQRSISFLKLSVRGGNLCLNKSTTIFLLFSTVCIIFAANLLMYVLLLLAVKIFCCGFRSCIV